MKLSELRYIIREEVRRVIKEVTISDDDRANYSPKFIKDVERLYAIESRARRMLYNSRSIEQLWSKPTMYKINNEWNKLTEKLFKTPEWKKWCKEKRLLDNYPFEDVLT
jgi:hypothetical protein